MWFLLILLGIVIIVGFSYSAIILGKYCEEIIKSFKETNNNNLYK